MDEETSVGIEKIHGHADERAACGIFTKRISFEGGVIGTIVSTILVIGTEGEDNQTYLRDIFEISTQKLENGNGKPLEVLKEAGEACRSYIEQRGLDVSFVNALIYKNAFYFGRYKEAVRIWVFAGNNSSELKFGYGSGLLSRAQIFLVGTDKFFATFDTSVLSGGSPLDLEGIIDGLATEISADSDQSEIGVAFIYVKDKGEDQGKEIVEEEHGRADLETHERVAQVLEDQTEAEGGEIKTDLLNSMERVSGPSQTALHLGIPSKVARGLLGILKGTLGEVSKLKKGDVGAILRLRRNVVLVAFLIILILGVSAFVTIRTEQNKQKLSQFNDHMKNASAKLMEGEAILELNRDCARTALSDADREVKAALGIKPEDSAAKELAGKITQKLKDTENVSTVNFQTFTNVGEPLVGISNAANGVVVFSGDKMYKIDGDGKITDEADTGTDVIAGVFSNDGFVLSEGKVYQQGFGQDKQSFSANKPKSIADSGNAFDVSVFLGNIYLLGSNQIAKYVPVEGGYAKSVDYLNNPEQFLPSSRFVIDGSVWVTNGKNINKYMRGAKEDFSISGLSDSNGEFGEIYTTADGDNLYVVDISNSALLVINKDGIYQKAYQSGEFAKSKAIMIDESAGKMYVVAGSKILEANL